MTNDMSDQVGAMSVATHFQPIVDLQTGAVVGAEALSRDGAGRVSIGELFRLARQDGTADRLDWACRVTALRTWLQASPDPALTLFVNVEGATLAQGEPRIWETVAGELESAGVPLVLEITERELARHPALLLEFRDRIKQRGWGLALDDVGADPSSLAFLPVLDPDIVKLDMHLLHRAPDLHTARVVNAVQAHVACSGALVLAEGVETPEHRFLAQSFGAQLAQGWLFGRPGPQVPNGEGAHPILDPDLVRLRAGGDPTRSPWQCVQDRTRTALVAHKPLLSTISRYLELQVATAEASTIAIAAFQDREHLGERTLRRFAELAGREAFVAVLGNGLSGEPAPGVRGFDVAEGDPIHDEWVVAVLSPHFAAALLAHDLGDDLADEEKRRFAYLVSYERDVVVDATRALIRRLV